MRKLLYLIFFISSFSFSQGWEMMKRASVEQADSGAIYDGQNAGDPANEVNGIANTTDSHLGIATWSSVTTLPHDGSYTLYLTHGSADNTQVSGLVEMTGVLDGQTVTLKIYVKEVVGATWRVHLSAADGWTATSTEFNLVGGGAWQSFDVTGTSNQDNPLVEFYTTTSGDQNDILAVDNVVITF